MITLLVLKAISLLENIRITVEGFVCDGTSTYRRLSKVLDIDGLKENLKNYFEHSIEPN